MSEPQLTTKHTEIIKAQILARAKEHNTLRSLTHIPEVVRWTEVILQSHPEANHDITICGAWLHDCGHLWPDLNVEDHAISGKKVASEILIKLGLGEQIHGKITRIVRNHRNRPDSPPITIEEKIVTAADSAAHFTDGCFTVMCTDQAMAPKGDRKTPL